MAPGRSEPRKTRKAWSFPKLPKRGLWLLKEGYRISLVWIFIPLLGALVFTFFISRVVARIGGPVSYKIYVVGDFSRPAALSIFEAFRNQHLQLGEVSLRVASEDDHGDPAEAERIAAKLASNEDTLLVIGHTSSTQTKVALPYYLEAKPPVPVILTVETTSNLAPSKVGRTSYDPIFRLSPTDDRQAHSVAEFIKNGQAVWVVEDLDNTVYSKSLATAFIREAQKKEKVVLWSTNISPPTAQAVHDLHIDWVFFAGRREDALILIRQLRAIGTLNKAPSIILSDSSANQDLIDRGKEDVEEVYVASQVTADEYNTEAHISMRPDLEGAAARVNYNKNAGYSIFGARALKVVQILLERASDPSNLQQAAAVEGWGYRARRLLGVHWVEDARSLLIATMEGAQNQHEPFILDDGTKVTFDVDEAGNDGARNDEDATFHIWQVKNGKFVDALVPGA